MFCPKCGMQSPDGLKYCRSCGTDMETVSKALTGELAPTRDRRRKRRNRGLEAEEYDPTKPPRLDRAVTNAFVGLGFICVALAIFLFAPAGKFWFWSFLFPAFGALGKAAAEYVRWKEQARLGGYAPAALQPPPSYTPPVPTTGELEQHRSFEHLPPPSVTEGTTRHLDATQDDRRAPDHAAER